MVAYRVLRLAGRATKARGVEGLAAPLVGRDPEMAALRAVLPQVSPAWASLS